MLFISHEFLVDMINHSLDAFPLEACGLLGGSGEHVTKVYRTRNDAMSARVYTVNPVDYLRADRDAETNGQSIIGVFHSHTHSEPYPSQTDLKQAPDPAWHYILVSLKRKYPAVRSYRIIGGKITEEEVVELKV